MTISEKKSAIIADINQKALNIIVDQFATVSAAYDELKAEHEALKKKHEAELSKATKKK